MKQRNNLTVVSNRAVPMRAQPSKFSTAAVGAFERTYQALFDQANIEVERLDKINRTMTVLENELLRPERVQEMEVGQQIALAQLLSRSSNDTIRNLMGFGQLFMNIRTVVGLLDGIQKHTAMAKTGTDGRFPTMESTDADYVGDD